MTANPLLALAVGALFALGAALIGWEAGLGAYSVLYEILRESNSEEILDSERTFELFRYCGWFLGAGLGAFVFWRWHRSDSALERAAAFKRWVVLGLTSAGATHFGYMLMHGVSVGAMVLTAFVSLVAGSAVAATAYGAPPPFASWIGRFVTAALAGVAILWVALAFDKGISAPYDALGKERFVWVKIALPENQARAEPEKIKAELRTSGASVNCLAIAWESDKGRAILPVRCDFTELTPDREIVVTLPGQPPMVLKMPVARNPKPMLDYSGWITSPGGIVFRYRVH